ncbi:uncharacterized protein EMH_0014700 [Eimeria mitis]|uniref:Uncharacterized protein n=1 Tax=Eimeria mitis TaxID=44415 RepID=U6K5J5_9EIME|nr:uncharacterized protein EMH_0014700 [Eimeria mitis]CDJ33089.1 hypothetical protein, conserved [Eimeria mitis]
MEADTWASVSWGSAAYSAAAANEELKNRLLGGVARTLELLLLEELQQQQQQQRTPQTQQRQQQLLHNCARTCICGCSSPCFVSVQQQEAAAAVAAGLLRRVYVLPVASLLLSPAPTSNSARSSVALLLPAEEVRQWQQQQRQQQEKQPQQLQQPRQPQQQQQQPHQWYLLRDKWRGPSLQTAGDLCLLVNAAAAAEATQSALTTATAAEDAAAAREAIAAEFVGPGLPAAAAELMEQRQQLPLMIQELNRGTNISNSSANSSSINASTTNSNNANNSNISTTSTNRNSSSGSSASTSNTSSSAGGNSSSCSCSGLFLSSGSRAAAGEVHLTRVEAANVQQYFSALEMMDVDGCSDTPADAPLPAVSLLQQADSSSSSSSSSSLEDSTGGVQKSADLFTVALETWMQTSQQQQQQPLKSPNRKQQQCLRERIAAEVIQRLAAKASSNSNPSSSSNSNDVAPRGAGPRRTTPAKVTVAEAGGATAATAGARVSSPNKALHFFPPNASSVSLRLIPALINNLPDFLDKRMQKETACGQSPAVALPPQQQHKHLYHQQAVKQQQQ